MSDIPPPPPGFNPSTPPPYGQTPPPGYQPYGGPMNMAPKTSGKAIAALVCGLVGILCFGIILGVVALVLGLSAKKEIESSGGQLTGGGMATAGIVLGVIGIAFWVIYIFAVVAN